MFGSYEGAACSRGRASRSSSCSSSSSSSGSCSRSQSRRTSASRIAPTTRLRRGERPRRLPVGRGVLRRQAATPMTTWLCSDVPAVSRNRRRASATSDGRRAGRPRSAAQVTVASGVDFASSPVPAARSRCVSSLDRLRAMNGGARATAPRPSAASDHLALQNEDELESLTSRKAKRDELEAAALRNGMRSPWDDGMDKGLAGLTRSKSSPASSPGRRRAARAARAAVGGHRGGMLVKKRRRCLDAAFGQRNETGGGSRAGRGSPKCVMHSGPESPV